ncbi:MAG: arginine--tRNA ligase, partial [Alphaproteobacteria bacterium]|nr:arginine--tRNA ligase [Alphaproteobacteria bacterium]
MNIFSHFSERITNIADQLIANGQITLSGDPIIAQCEPPRDPSHGDLSTNVAMVMAKSAGMSPRDLAALFGPHIQALDGIETVSIAGPGFINMTLATKMWQDRISDILTMGSDWGNSTLGQGETINVEYVSANPTGPLHAAHARGAIVGDSLANLLEKSGYLVTREYYINDAGAQVDVLARSVFTRYRQALGDKEAMVGEGQYPGEYLIETGQKIADLHGDDLLKMDESAWLPLVRDFAIKDMMVSIKTDLERLNIHMDRFSSERALVDSGTVDATTLDGTTLRAQTGIVTNLTSTDATITRLAPTDTVGTAATFTTLEGTTANFTTVDGDTIDAGSNLYAVAGVVTTLTATTGNITTVDATTVDAGSNLYAVAGVVTTLTATTGNITTVDATTVDATTVDAENLRGVTGIVTTISGTTATYDTVDAVTVDAGTNLRAVTGVVTTLTSTDATITRLTPTDTVGTAATFTTLDATTGNITTVNATTVDGDTIDAGTNLYAVSGVVTTLTATTGNITTVDATTIDASANLRAVAGIVTTLESTDFSATRIDSVTDLKVTGVSTFQSHVHLGDDDELRFGA